MLIVWNDPHVCSTKTSVVDSITTACLDQHQAQSCTARIFSPNTGISRTAQSLANLLAVCGSKPNGAVLFSKVNRHMLQICCIEI